MSEPPHPGSLFTASAFADLLQTTQAALYAFACRLTNSGEEARDIVQDVYVVAWQAAQRGTPPFDEWGNLEALRRWLVRVAYRKAVTYLRHHEVIRWEPFDSADEAHEPIALVPIGHTRPAAPFDDQVAEGEVLRSALAQLKPDDAACLLLAIIEDFTTGEIAQILGIAPAAARKRLSRAMERLRVAYFAQEVEGKPANQWKRARR